MPIVLSLWHRGLLDAEAKRESRLRPHRHPNPVQMRRLASLHFQPPDLLLVYCAGLMPTSAIEIVRQTVLPRSLSRSGIVDHCE